MKIPIVLFLLLFIIENVKAFRPDSTRTELLLLLKERKVLFDQYSASLNKKSGFFGNRTKSDLKDSQEKLVAIVSADNRIMNSLNRTLDYRNFEKLNMSYDANSFEERIRNLIILNDTLNNQNIIYKQENKIYQSSIKKHHLYFASLIILLILACMALLRKIFYR